jgi:hypothetical protein
MKNSLSSFNSLFVDQDNQKYYTHVEMVHKNKSILIAELSDKNKIEIHG